MGYPIFYSDQEAKRLLNTNEELKKEVITIFGAETYVNGELQRAYLAQKVFNDTSLLEQLNAVVHPSVRRAFERWVSLQTSTLVFNEAAILFETGGYKSYDANVLVTASIETRIQRVMKRDNTDREAVIKRMEKQWSDEKKEKLADYIIKNEKDTPLLPQIITLINDLNK